MEREIPVHPLEFQFSSFHSPWAPELHAQPWKLVDGEHHSRPSLGKKRSWWNMRVNVCQSIFPFSSRPNVRLQCSRASTQLLLTGGHVSGKSVSGGVLSERLPETHSYVPERRSCMCAIMCYVCSSVVHSIIDRSVRRLWPDCLIRSQQLLLCCTSPMARMLPQLLLRLKKTWTR